MEPYIPVGGTPLIPPSYLTVYFGVFITFLGIIYVYFYRKKRPVLLWQKVKLFLVIAALLKITFILGMGLLAVYWLVPSPGIRRTLPAGSSSTFSPTNKIEIVFDRPVSRGLMEKTISPETPGVWVFENSIYTTHLYRNLVFYPTYSLRPNTKYTIQLANVRNLLNVSPAYDYKFEFTTQASPKVVAVSPVSGEHQVPVSQNITVTLDNPNADISDFDFQFNPAVEYEEVLSSTKTSYTLTPKRPLKEGVEYNLKILKTDVILNLSDKSVVERSPASLEYDGTFTTEGTFSEPQSVPREPAKIIMVSPENGWTAVSVNSPITVTFNKVPNQETTKKFSLEPEVQGDFSWNGNMLTFTPQKPLSFSTTYTISDSESDFKSSFTTQEATVKLKVPVYLQKYTLSCEVAALRMALNFKGANVSEDDLIPKVGTDNTPHIGDTWGNPYNAFVGNIRGTQMKDGYGVYWGPIARAARDYRNAQEFEGWTIEALTGTIKDGNPVVIWVYSHFGTPTSWNTPDGTKIYAVRDEHAVTAVGFVGPATNPTQIIINDPLVGQVYWSRATFDKKWNIFNRSGVVIY